MIERRAMDALFMQLYATFVVNAFSIATMEHHHRKSKSWFKCI